MALTTDLPLDALVAALAGDPRLAHVERLAPRPAQLARTARPLPPRVVEALGVDALWTHQARAIDLARAGSSVAVATGTASGKSLCFQAPIAEAITDPIRPGTALCIFPTKALARDQLRAFADLGLPGLVAGVYDGDCSQEERAWVRRNANVVLTNPEMLHCALLPHHTRWATFLLRLRFVVLDELHAFRGVFGTHVAHLLRRLRRLAVHYQANPTLVACSATIGEPGGLASALWGGPVEAVTDDGSPRGERLVALWRGDDESSGTGTAELLAELIGSGHRAIGFCRSRRGTELVAAGVRRRLPSELAETVRPYRGGYLPAERREIEEALFSGELRGVVATNALELGVDIGGLDACVLNGFPGTIASFWQQAGRAGRERQQSLAVLVAGDDQLDRWLLDHPAELFTRPPEPAVINPANPFVLLPHLACAAFERPLTHDDERWWPELLDDGVRDLAVSGRLKVRATRGGPAAVWAAKGFPAHGVGLRSGSGAEYRIVRGDGSLVGTVDAARAFEQVHPGAVYLHQGCSYRVVELDLGARTAVVEPDNGNEWTMARTDVDIRIGAVDDERRVGRVLLRLGAVEVESRVTGFQRRDARTGEVVASARLDLPPALLVTRAFWYVLDEEVLLDAGLVPARWPGTLHAAEHAGIGILPLFTICDRWDVGGVSTVALPAPEAERARPGIVIHDAHPGGAGIAELGFGVADRHLAATLEVLEGCGCDGGCPSCVQSPKCGNWNEPLDKTGAAALLRAVLS